MKDRGSRTLTQTHLTRYLTGLAATTDTTTTPLTGTTTTSTLALGNPHGDIVTTIAVPTTGNATGITNWTTTDEYGNPPTPTPTPTTGTTPANYTWHGNAQQSADTPSGLVLMGARLYTPVAGSFASPDPVYGGNATAYAYPGDPINWSDLDGKKKCNAACDYGASVAYGLILGLGSIVAALLCAGTALGWAVCRAVISGTVNVLGAYVAAKIRGQRYTTAGQDFVTAFVAGLFIPASLAAKAKELIKQTVKLVAQKLARRPFVSFISGNIILTVVSSGLQSRVQKKR